MNMKTTMKIMLMTVCLLMGLTMRAQDTKSQFNPIEHAVISQTIAPDARAAGIPRVRPRWRIILAEKNLRRNGLHRGTTSSARL